MNLADAMRKVYDTAKKRAAENNGKDTIPPALLAELGKLVALNEKAETPAH